ncbi:MAG: FliO/MopB family protein [Salinispira sp.]
MLVFSQDVPEDESAASANNESEITLSFSDDSQAIEEGDQAVQVFGFGDLIRMVLVLALVVGMIYGLYFLLRRSKKVLEDESSFISLLSTQTLPGGRQLYIVDVAGRVYLLGAGDGNLSLITEIDDKPTIDALRLESSRQDLRPRSFSQLMNTFFLRNSTGNSAQSTPDQLSGNGFSFLHQQRKRLKKL